MTRDPRVREYGRRVLWTLGEMGVRAMWRQWDDFRPEFKPDDISGLAGAYNYADDAAARAVGQSARQRGWMTRDELLEIGGWKTNDRQRPNLGKNTEAAIKAASKIAFDPNSSEEARLKALRSLQGVDAPVASAVLHFYDPDRWSILDWRVLEALGHDQPKYYSFKFWKDFQQAAGEFADDAGVSRRVFDKAGFMWSKLHGKGAGG